MVARASSKSPSIRATIPEKITKEMSLNVGDVLDWEIEKKKPQSNDSEETRMTESSFAVRSFHVCAHHYNQRTTHHQKRLPDGSNHDARTISTHHHENHPFLFSGHESD